MSSLADVREAIKRLEQLETEVRAEVRSLRTLLAKVPEEGVEAPTSFALAWAA